MFFRIKQNFASFLQKERGVAASEYGILASLLAVTAILSITSFGSNLATLYCSIGKAIAPNSILLLSSGKCTNNGGGYQTGAVYSIYSGGGAGCVNPPASMGECSLEDGQLLYMLNQIDPIKSVYGLRNGSNQDMTTYDQAMSIMQQNITRGYGVNNSTLGQSFQYEVQGSSGKTYGVYYNNGNLGFKNLVTGQTYQIDGSSGSLKDMGVTNLSGS